MLGNNGFTLIELSIVLVIIGLIIGGVLVGQDLIAAAAVRSQVTQIEKYNTAVNTFRGKFGGLPGDLANPSAAQFGLAARGSLEGEGDGNGVIEGDSVKYPDRPGLVEGVGETAVFWVDLSTANLLDGGFNTAQETGWSTGYYAGVASHYFPSAKIGRGNYIYVWSGGMGNGVPVGNNQVNYFGISQFTDLTGNALLATNGGNNTLPGLTVNEAYRIDAKVDDGLPQSGSVTAIYVWGNVVGWAGSTWGALPSAGAVSGTATSCYDSSTSGTAPYSGVTGATKHYSTEYKGGTNVNCALSFQFQ